MASGDTLAVFVPAANQPPAANYASLALRNGRLVLVFNDTTQQTAIFAGVLPRYYGGGGITVYLHTMAVAVTGNLGWGVTFERGLATDLDADDWATEQIAAGVAVDATSGKVSISSVAVAAGAAGTDSIGVGEPFRLRVRRNVATSGNAVGDGQLLSVELKET